MAGLLDFLNPSNSNSSGGGGGGVLGADILPATPGGNLGAGFASFAHSSAPLPAIANLISGLITGQRTDPTGVQQDLMRAQLQSLLQMPDYQGAGGLAHAMQTISNPAVSTAQFGNPSELGQMKLGPIEIPVVGHAGHASLATGGGQLNDLLQAGLKAQQAQSAATSLGTAQGTNQAGLPNALAQADQAIGLINDIKSDPNTKMAVGAIAGRLPAIGGGQANVVAKIDQLKGQAFMQAWQGLKGSGARITNTESVKAESAIGRLNRVQDYAGFNQALNDLHDVISGVRDRAYTNAGLPQPATSAPPASTQAPSFSQADLLAEAKRRGLVH